MGLINKKYNRYKLTVKPKGPSVWLLRIIKAERQEHRIFVFVDNTKDFHSNNVPNHLCQIIGRSWESMQIERKVADEC